MSDAGNAARSLREKLGANTEDRLGRALSELLENPLLTGAIGRAFDAREKAAQAQEVAMGALNIPSAADIERLTRRLRAVSHRLEAIEDGVDRLDRALTPSGVEARLASIETTLESLGEKVERALRDAPGQPTAAAPSRRGRGSASDREVRAAKEARARTAGDARPRTTRAAKAGASGDAKAGAGRTAKATKAARTASTAGARSRAGRGAPGKT